MFRVESDDYVIGNIDVSSRKDEHSSFGKRTTIATMQNNSNGHHHNGHGYGQNGYFVDTSLKLSDKNHSEDSLGPIFRPQRKMEEGAKKHGRKIGIGTCFCLSFLFITTVLGALVGLGYYFFWPDYSMLLEASKAEDGTWSDFSAWSECSTTCGPGEQKRIRFCLNLKNDGKPCDGEREEVRVCNARIECPDCGKKCAFGSLNKDCTKCTCENHTVTGKVSDSTGQPIIGASIRRTDVFMDTLAISNFQGEFSITGVCSNGDNSLTASKVGFNPRPANPVEISVGSARVEIRLEHVSLPRILINPQPKIRFVGQSARLCCSAQDDGSGTFPLRVNWYFNNKLVEEGEAYNQTSTDLKLSDIRKEDAGEYFCQVTNNAGVIRTQKVKLEVKEKSESSCLPPKVYSVEICPTTSLKQGNCATSQRCNHPEQHLSIESEKCVDQVSDYCCQVGASDQIEVTCPVPGSADLTYLMPIQNSTSCACLPCQ
ncbi:Oidioi.mRNA.OKI2018_I69.chr2.g4002.t1.cds [Oikopleura dioica]|uniref:Oidioi.mRNA.OKI2018_I69.chr2.g4002.t1.cds n=1 Tax=Oikopleura dioica TaxID=34765 RepID=A0ABN7SZU6_OIKDI|nr:Oidioi.mRNA.OKI2018_I69.chr2.g4002.t1.cds [Oikopleura dioica]